MSEPDGNQTFDETIMLSRRGLESKPEIQNRTLEDTLVLPKTDLNILSGRTPVPLSRSFAMTKPEKNYFKKIVNTTYICPNKYNFENKLIEGGMGAIFKVLDKDMQRVSALKVILPKFRNDETALNDFMREARITGLLEHPNIIPVHELGLLNEAGMFFSMKLAQGKALIDVLNEVDRNNQAYLEKYTTYMLLNIFRKVCDALSFAHSKNILHQDIKPHNIMVGEYGEVLLMDWGLASYIGQPEQEPDPIQRAIFVEINDLSKGNKGMIKGSPPYMAPEQVLGSPDHIGKHTDVFLMGATLYHMFTLRAPYFGKDIYEVLHKAENRNLIHPRKRNSDKAVPEEISEIIMKAMEPDRKNRYNTVDELSRDIDDIISGKWSYQEQKEFVPGEMLINEGETGEEAYMIMDGQVEVFTKTNTDKIVFGTLKQGDIVGEMALITKEKRSANVKAIDKTLVSVLTKNVLNQNMNKLPSFMQKIVSTLTNRLRMA
ncbi:serine/threonine-protein kinase, partial [Desulfobacterales bacterium HSG16]|nr:serine/threonine-protein kinase [Desulfobacterales bacterium HSG16]